MTNPIGAITGSQVAYTAAKAAQPTQLPTNTTNLNQLEADTVSFKGKGKEEKSNSKALALIGTIATVGAAFLCKKAFNIGKLAPGTAKATTLTGKFKQAATRTYDGFKRYINKATTAVGKWNFKNVKPAEELADAKWYEKGLNTAKSWWNKGTEWVGKQYLNVNPAA